MRILALLVAVVVFHPSLGWAAEDAEPALTADAPTAAVDARSASSDRGGVILDGQYIAPPYDIVAVAEGVELNGHFVPEAGFNERGRRRRDDAEYVPFADRIRDRLDEGAWLLGWEDGEYGMFGESRFSEILYTLDADAPEIEKVDQLEGLGIAWIERADWRLLVDRVELPAGVLEQYGVASDEVHAVEPVLAAKIQAPVINFQRSIYLLTVFGIAATVFALGTLLSYRPGEKMSWSSVNTSRDATRLVLRSILLLIGLAVLDLVCTSMSARTVGFWELNPLGAIILSSPFILGAFKLGATLTSGSILFMLRRYHGAQVASWWLALFCTVLAIRWVTYNSMFMA